MAEEFSNVTIIKKANIYFDGGVTSRIVIFPDGSRKTLGIMQPGEYKFDTAEPEIMAIISGELEVLLPGESAWRPVKGGEQFKVPGQAAFCLKIKKVTDYCCSFVR